MLAELVEYSEQATLIMQSGVQFMDFGLTLDLRKEDPGEFVLQASARSLARLELDKRGRHVHPGNPAVAITPKLDMAVDESCKLLDSAWLPIPVLRAGPNRAFDEGPTTWARARLVEIDKGEDLRGHSHRLTLAFDTNVLEDTTHTAYLAPTREDIKAGAAFLFTHRAHEMGWFTEIPWIGEWLEEVFRDAGARLGLPVEDLDDEVKRLFHHAHYLNLLWVIGAYARLPEVRLRSNAYDDVFQPIPVDMVLDVGNSRTCGILVEDHPQEHNGLKNRYELSVRDLSEPHRVYVDPFESRVEFAQASLGKDRLSRKSGRSDAFVWPTIARVGGEAARLAGHRRGTEGSTGLSSPKRYLWDTERFASDWRFNVAANRAAIEPIATGAFTNLINELGEPLYDPGLPEEKRIPVFDPHYTRSSLMTFLLAEILVHALVQINSPAQRLKQGHPEKPRHLRSIIITVPPSMPKPEREIYAARLEQAMALVWKALGWHPEDDCMDAEGRESAWPRYPEVHAEWDEATCAQAVYLFSEVHENFAGRAEDLFRCLRRRGSPDAGRVITVASIDIGGGTTDLVVADYRLQGQGANVYILPEQRFRDGFKRAGDDLLLEVIEKMLVPAIQKALREFGVREPTPLLSRLIGSESISAQDKALRQQFALEVLYPLGLKVLHDYEGYDPVQAPESRTLTFRELLGKEPSPHVLDYFAQGVRRATGRTESEFNLLEVPLYIDLYRLHRFFLEDDLEIAKTIRALCEIVYLYDCDVLLLSGRPSRLPGVQSLFRRLLPLPPDRIVPLNGYRAGVWYPFHREGRILDPKTTAVVGAMICKVGGERRIPNFNLMANAFKVYSTVRYLGLIDQNLVLKDTDVYYRDINLDDEKYELPEAPFEVRGRMVLGFRQLDSERWPASPLYVMDLSDDTKKKLMKDDPGQPNLVQVKLKYEGPKKKRQKGTDLFTVGRAEIAQGSTLGRGEMVLKLNTLLTVGLGESSYWLDTGSVSIDG